MRGTIGGHMDEAEARNLSKLTNEFYAHVADSFSATRQAPWPGWERVLASCASCNEGEKPAREGCHTGPFRVLDLACGNLRFERFLSQRVPSMEAWAVDLCDELVRDRPPNVHYQHLDLARSPADVTAPPCDLCVTFGFMHHLPTFEQRSAVLTALVDHTRLGGIVAASFWQFEHDPRLRAKATPLGERGDYLLGWQDQTEVARYCHSFDEGEIDALATTIAGRAHEVDRFWADGKSGRLNRYVVWQRAAE